MVDCKNTEDPTGKIEIKLNDVTITVDPNKIAFIKDGSTMVPLRTIAENRGLEVSYTPQAVTLVSPQGTTIVAAYGSNLIERNGEEVSIAGSLINKNGTSYLPIRVVAEALDCNVGYDSATKTVSIFSN